MTELTQDYLKSAIDYNSETGVFIWKHREDMPKTWNSRYAGKVIGWNHSHGYVQACINYKKYFLHRLAWFYMVGEWPKEIDHIDMNKKNNRFSNLRNVTHSQNGQNRKMHKDNLSGLKGVTFSRDCKKGVWLAVIQVENKPIRLGRFKTKELAHAAYCEAAKKYHGEFARLA